MKPLKNLLTILLILLPLSAYAWGVAVISGGVAAGAPAGDTCGSGGLLFSWHCENADVTAGTPAGCSSGDTTATATNASISTATATPDAGDGDGSALFESESERYSFDLSSGDVLASSQGHITFRLRVHTWLNGATIFRGYGSDTNQILVGLYGTNRLKISYIGNGTSTILYTSNDANGQLAADTWYLVTLRYRVGETDPSMSIQLDALTATTTNDNLTEMNDTTGNLHFGGWDGGTCVWNLDDVHIYNAYAD